MIFESRREVGIKMISHITIVSMIAQVVVLIIFLVSIFLFFKRRQILSYRPLWMGILVFLLFSQILENIVHFFVLKHPMFKHPYLLAFYGALAAGLFEEVGRYVGFRYWLKKHREYKDGLSFGFGHGGIETVLFGVFTGIQAVVFAFLINSGGFDSLVTSQPALAKVKQALMETPYYLYFLTIIEKICALMIQIALSLIVLYSVCKKQIRFLFLAIFLHMLIDIFAGLFAVGKLNLFVVEAIVMVFGILSFLGIKRFRRWFSSNHGKESISNE